MRPSASTMRLVLILIATLVLSSPAWLMLIVAETASGRLAGLLPCVVFLVPALLLAARTYPRARWVALALSGVAIAIVVVLLVRAPDGRALDANAPRSTFLTGQQFDRWNVPNVVPEIDQIKYGTYLVPFVDPFIDWRQSVRLREVSMAVYRPMEADPSYRALGSVMSSAYRDVDVGHVFEYVPPHEKDERLPTLIFLHGSAGNFKVYFHLWRTVADAARVILVCPSFGFGNWNRPEGLTTIDRTVQHVLNDLPSDPDRLVLAGLSNGGRGVTRAMALHPSRYAGAVLISAVMEPIVVDAPPLPGAYLGKPVLVLHGAKDRRIPLVYAESGAQLYRDHDARVTMRVYEDEDHFLFFSKSSEVLGQVTGWLEAL